MFLKYILSISQHQHFLISAFENRIYLCVRLEKCVACFHSQMLPCAHSSDYIAKHVTQTFLRGANQIELELKLTAGHRFIVLFRDRMSSLHCMCSQRWEKRLKEYIIVADSRSLVDSRLWDKSINKVTAPHGNVSLVTWHTLRFVSL